MNSVKLDREEKDLLESFERGEWVSVRDRKTEVSRLGTAARATLRKNRRINIRLSDRDVIGLQAKAAEEGIPYQTLISSVLHKYLTGTLWMTEMAWPNKASHRTTNPRRVGVR
jgi:predicted DNA binding CopG/RHH family protein